MDNPIFNINGRMGDGTLLAALELRMRQKFPTRSLTDKLINGHEISKEKGFILYSSCFLKDKIPWDISRQYLYDNRHGDYIHNGIVIYENSKSLYDVLNDILLFLKNGSNDVEGWDADPLHYNDVICHPGWRVYCEDWGHIDHDWEAFVAIKKVWLWSGK